MYQNYDVTSRIISIIMQIFKQTINTKLLQTLNKKKI